MGWTSARHWNSMSKKEIFTEETGIPKERILKFETQGNTCYIAAQHIEGYIFGCVALFRKMDGDMGIKVISEDMGPCYYGTSPKLIGLLSPTDNKWANEWRQKCLSTPKKLPNFRDGYITKLDRKLNFVVGEFDHFIKHGKQTFACDEVGQNLLRCQNFNIQRYGDIEHIKL